MTDTNRTKVLITAEELLALGAEGKQHIVVLDVRIGNEGRLDYLDGHIRDAVFVDLATEFAGEPHGFSGKRPLPKPEMLTRDARRWGVREESLIVLYDDNANRQAARGWWTLLWGGAQNVKLLDGGLRAWREAGGEVNSSVPLPQRGNITLPGGFLSILDADAAAAFARVGVLLDARDADAYRGALEGGGHIPGAVNFPTGDNIDQHSGRFLSAEALRNQFSQFGLGVEQNIGVYCGGGVAAAHEIAALTIAGYKTLLFPGSWSAWSADETRPIATGSEPG